MIKNFRTRAFLRIFLMSSSRKKNLGFSLLEMLIVLAMMAGMMAMVWPNLQRPLQRAALNDAVSTLRSVLDEARYQAMTRGEIWLVRLEVGSQELAVGDFGCYLQLAEQNSTGDRQPTVFPLPDTVYIADVIWSSDPTANGSIDPADGPMVPIQRPTLGQEARLPSATVFCLPILASGRSRDASIRLADSTTGQSVWVVFLESTGSVETFP